MNRFQAGAPAMLALAAALAAGVFGLSRGTWAAGGSDSSCYALMADAFARGRLQPATTVPGAPWPDAALTLAPAGFLPSPVRTGAASPICAPGYSLLLAPLVALTGTSGVFLLTPMAASLLVWLCFVLGRRLGGPWAGVLAAGLVAAAPIVLFQTVQPMNDITVAALWTAVVVALTDPLRPRLWMAGAAMGAALLVRPNLLPAGLVVAAWVLAWGGAADLRSPWRGGAAALLKLGSAAAPFGLLVLGLNHALYGGAFQSGYGDVRSLFAWANIPMNAARHARAVVETQAGFPLLGLVAPFLAGGARREAMLAWLVALSIVACYLPYQSFPEWWYLRFLLPAVALLTVLASVSLVALLQRSRLRQGFGGQALGIVGTAALVLFFLRAADRRQAFELWRLEARYRHVAEAMLDHLPPATVAIAVWDSGSIRFHARLDAVLWDSLDPGWLDRAAAWLLAQGRPPVVVVERWEEPLFRARFGSRSVIGALDWPPRLDVDGLVRVYDPADRVRYLAGERVETTIVAPRR